MTLIRRSLAACLGILALSGVAQAEMVFQFDQVTYEVAAGETFDVKLFLVEQGTSILATDGLVAGFTKLTYNESPFATDPAQIGSVADILKNPGFDFTPTPTLTQATGSSAGVADIALATLGAAVLPEAATPDRILLATYRFVAGSVVGEATSLRASLLDPAQSNFVSGAIPPVDLDSLIGEGTARILVVGSVPVIPEPSSIVLAGLGLAFSLGAVLRRRRLLALA